MGESPAEEAPAREVLPEPMAAEAMRLRRLATHWLEVHDVHPPSLRIAL